MYYVQFTIDNGQTFTTTRNYLELVEALSVANELRTAGAHAIVCRS